MTVSTLPDIRPLSGAASVPGPEAELATRFIGHTARRYENAILAPEVPIRGGVVDLLRLQFRSPEGIGSLSECRGLGQLADQALFTLASFRPNQRYTFSHLRQAGTNVSAIADLALVGLVTVKGDVVIRPSQLADRIASVTAYEFKITDNHVGLRQAALRRSAVTRSYLVTAEAPTGAFPESAEFQRLGVGWISVGDRPVRRIGAEMSRSPRWARFLMLRAIVRGLERRVSPNVSKRLQSVG